jgi:alanine racemase
MTKTYRKNKTIKNKQNKTIKKREKREKTCLTGIPSYGKNITAEININDFKYNINYLKKKAKTEIMPVLKANAYGHGIVEMAKISRQIGIKYIGVATLGEAIQIRDSGDKGRILGWLYDVYSVEMKDAIEKNIDIGIFDENHIPIIEKIVPKGVKAKIHLFVDTGIDRNGVVYENAINAAKQIISSDKFELVGLMSHFCCSETKNNKYTLKQLELFRKLRDDLAKINIKPELVHIGNTNGILNYDMSDFTLSRSGAGIYGYGTDKNLKPIMSINAKIIQLKYVAKGQGIGYDRTFITKHKMRIGIVSIGYADFLPLTKSEELSVTVNGTRRKVLGLESMDQIVIEGHKNDKLGDVVHIFGNKNKGFISAEELAKMGHTTLYNMLTHVGSRVDHKYFHF